MCAGFFCGRAYEGYKRTRAGKFVRRLGIYGKGRGARRVFVKKDPGVLRAECLRMPGESNGRHLHNTGGAPPSGGVRF